MLDSRRQKKKMSFWKVHNPQRLLSCFLLGLGAAEGLLLPYYLVQIFSEEYSESELKFSFYIPLRMPETDKVGNGIIIFGRCLLSFTD